MTDPMLTDPFYLRLAWLNAKKRTKAICESYERRLADLEFERDNAIEQAEQAEAEAMARYEASEAE